MKLTIRIKDSKVAFFLELLRSFEDFITVEKVEETQDTTLSEEHKVILDERLTSYKSDPKSLLDWEQVHTELEQNS
jgi:hypothetical protein